MVSPRPSRLSVRETGLQWSWPARPGWESDSHKDHWSRHNSPASADCATKQESWRLGSSQHSEILEVTEVEETPCLVQRMLVGRGVWAPVAQGSRKAERLKAESTSSVCCVVTRRVLSTEIYKQKTCSWMWTQASYFGFSSKFTFYNKPDTFWGGPPHAVLEHSQGRTIGSHPVYTGKRFPAFRIMETQGAMDAGSEQNVSHSILVNGMRKSAGGIFHSPSQLERHFKADCEGSEDYCGSWIWGTKALHGATRTGQTDFLASTVSRGVGDPGLTDRPEIRGNVPVSLPGYKRSEARGLPHHPEASAISQSNQQ